MADMRVLAAGRAHIKASRQNLVKECQKFQYDRTLPSNTLPLILLQDGADPRVKRAQDVRQAAEKATANWQRSRLEKINHVPGNIIT